MTGKNYVVCHNTASSQSEIASIATSKCITVTT